MKLSYRMPRLRLASWPAGCASGCAIKPSPLYLAEGGKAAFAAPRAGGAAFDEYVSDPGKPVPFRRRPIEPPSYEDNIAWRNWLVTDQREASGRPDVLSFTTDVLTAPVKISGQPAVHLIASTSGTDSDWVVKVIDVYPDEVASDPTMGGYQLMISADIFRGRYREGLDIARPIAADRPLLYRFDLPNANHVFLPGHRIMVQIQSSWFPLYDRNPQTFVPNIFWARPADYRKATQRVINGRTQEALRQMPAAALEPDEHAFQAIHNRTALMRAHGLAQPWSGVHFSQPGFNSVKVLQLTHDPSGCSR